MVAQTQSFENGRCESKTDKSHDNPLCRMCRQKEETVPRILCECPKLAYHNGVVGLVHSE